MSFTEHVMALVREVGHAMYVHDGCMHVHCSSMQPCLELPLRFKWGPPLREAARCCLGVARIPSHYVLVGHRVAHQGCVWLDCYAAPNQTACGPRPREAVGRSPALGPSKTGACLTLRGGASLALRGGAETLSLLALPVTMASKTLHGIHVMVVDPIGGRRFGPSGRCLVPEQGTPHLL